MELGAMPHTNRSCLKHGPRSNTNISNHRFSARRSLLSNRGRQTPSGNVTGTVHAKLLPSSCAAVPQSQVLTSRGFHSLAVQERHFAEALQGCAIHRLATRNVCNFKPISPTRGKIPPGAESMCFGGRRIEPHARDRVPDGAWKGAQAEQLGMNETSGSEMLLWVCLTYSCASSSTCIRTHCKPAS